MWTILRLFKTKMRSLDMMRNTMRLFVEEDDFVFVRDQFTLMSDWNRKNPDLLWTICCMRKLGIKSRFVDPFDQTLESDCC